jgi:hypothetical protein
MKPLKAHLIISATKCDFKQILFTTHDKVDEMIKHGIEYPALWFMLPFSYKKIRVDHYKAKQWNIEFLVLHNVQRDLTADELVDEYEIPTTLLDLFFETLADDSIESNGQFLFDEENSDEIHPKLQHTVDNSIGWYVEAKIIELTA